MRNLSVPVKIGIASVQFRCRKAVSTKWKLTVSALNGESSLTASLLRIDDKEDALNFFSNCFVTA